MELSVPIEIHLGVKLEQCKVGGSVLLSLRTIESGYEGPLSLQLINIRVGATYLEVRY